MEDIKTKINQLEDSEMQWANVFIAEHDNCQGEKVEGQFDLIFTKTYLGRAVEIVCTLCKEKKDITDYLEW